MATQRPGSNITPQSLIDFANARKKKAKAEIERQKRIAELWSTMLQASHQDELSDSLKRAIELHEANFSVQYFIAWNEAIAINPDSNFQAPYYFVLNICSIKAKESLLRVSGSDEIVQKAKGIYNLDRDSVSIKVFSHSLFPDMFTDEHVMQILGLEEVPYFKLDLILAFLNMLTEHDSNFDTVYRIRPDSGKE